MDLDKDGLSFEEILDEFYNSPCIGCKYYIEESPKDCKTCSRDGHKGSEDNYAEYIFPDRLEDCNPIEAELFRWRNAIKEGNSMSKITENDAENFIKFANSNGDYSKMKDLENPHQFDDLFIQYKKLSSKDKAFNVESEDIEKDHDIVHQLTAIRKEKGISQKKLAQLVGVSDRLIYRVESGDTHTSFDNICKIAKVLGYELSIKKLE